MNTLQDAEILDPSPIELIPIRHWTGLTLHQVEHIIRDLEHEQADRPENWLPAFLQQRALLIAQLPAGVCSMHQLIRCRQGRGKD